MRLLILIIFITRSLASYESSNEDGKYIDLLPDEEKREFLDRVARRILAQINTKATPPPYKHSVEISDDLLDKHSNFVNKILEEESKNLRVGSEINEKGDSKEEKVTQESQDIQDTQDGNNFTAHNENKVQHIDLTLREGIRQKRNTSSDTEVVKDTTEINHKVIPVKTLYDEDSNITLVKSINLLNENNDDVDKSEIDIQVMGMNRPSKQKINNNETQIPVIVVQSNTGNSNFQQQEDQVNPVTEKFAISTTILNVDENYISSNNPGTISEYLQNIDLSATNSNVNRTEEFLEKNTGNISSEDLVANVSVNIFEVDPIITNIEKNDANNSKSNNKNVATIQNDQFTNGNIQSMTVNPLDKSTINIYVNVKNESEFLTKETTPPSKTTTLLYILQSKSNTQNKDGIAKQLDNATYENVEIDNLTTVKEVTSTTEITPVTTFILHYNNSATAQSKKPLISVIKQMVNKNSTFSLKVNSKEPVDNMDLSFATNIKHALRERVHVDETKSEEVRKISYNIKSSSEQSEDTYQVYEIRQGQLPFVKRGDELKKQNQEEMQYYAPIYNYSPDNAYYYPYNKFSPNYGIEPESGVHIGNMHYNNKYVSMFNKQQNEGDNRKFRFKMTNHKSENRNRHPKPEHNKNPYQLVLPPAPIKSKPVELFFDNYSDDGYVFNGGSKMDNKYGTQNEFQNSDEHEYVDSIYNFRTVPKKFAGSNGEYLFNNNLKDSLRSLRTVLRNKKHDHISLSEKGRKINVVRSKTDDVYVGQLPQPLGKMSVNPMNDGRSYISAEHIFDIENANNHGKTYIKMLPIIQKSNSDKSNYKKRWTKLPKLNHYLHDFMMDILSATPNPLQNDNIILNKISDSNANNFKNVRYSGNIVKQSTDLEDNHFMLENLDKLLGPPKADNEVAAFVIVMQNLLEDNSEALQHYDWLETTVKIQSAIEKLRYMIDSLLNGETLHPADLELLQYVTFLHIVAQHEIDKKRAINREPKIRKAPKTQNKSLLPRNKSRPKYDYVKDEDLIDRVWLYRANINVTARYNMHDFKQFLDDLQDGLYDLHNALKHISMVTSYNNQRWFRNLEDLYLNGASTKQYLELILHLSTVRLIDLIEDSSKNGLEDNFMLYVKKNRQTVRRSIEEFVFVKRLLEEIIKL